MQVKILYIDDELDLLDIAASFFEEESLPIETCSDMNDALERINKTHYDLIITDANLPSGSGYDLCHLIKRNGIFKGKIVLVTGNIENFGDDQNSEFDLIIYKPVRFQELVAQVKKIMSF